LHRSDPEFKSIAKWRGPAKPANKYRVSEKTIERLSDEGLLRRGNANRTFVVLTNGDEP
jgi:hypothetical protein